jgi:hypothetical protein
MAGKNGEGEEAAAGHPLDRSIETAWCCVRIVRRGRRVNEQLVALLRKGKSVHACSI